MVVRRTELGAGMLALADVEYLITAEIRLTERADPRRDSLEKYRGLFVNRASEGEVLPSALSRLS